MHSSEKVIVECPATVNIDANVKRQTVNFLQVSHSCYSTATLCNKIKEIYNDAGKEISKNIKYTIYTIYVFVFSLNVHPEYLDYDIDAEFNADQYWWFKPHNVTIKSTQYDFYATVLHELGFLSSWSDYFETLDFNFNDSNMTSFNSYSEFVTGVKSSTQWKYAESVLISATINYKPFARGSSICHVSQRHYSTSEFLMT
ncbi:hypothetical protein Glove_64g78 [Diversispora epigaea]|uniref:Uncharacterized protein n=1 Tax=Diversispora epigaea TaxID=1348612 RepID=A0A397JDB9_9GLOM|nr:hypothetical protein Glove_64g78 [Diversispora epigaea]